MHSFSNVSDNNYPVVDYLEKGYHWYYWVLESSSAWIYWVTINSMNVTDTSGPP